MVLSGTRNSAACKRTGAVTEFLSKPMIRFQNRIIVRQMRVLGRSDPIHRTHGPCRAFARPEDFKTGELARARSPLQLAPAKAGNPLIPTTSVLEPVRFVAHCSNPLGSSPHIYTDSNILDPVCTYAQELKVDMRQHWYYDNQIGLPKTLWALYCPAPRRFSNI